MTTQKKEIAVKTSELKQYDMTKPAEVVKMAAVVKNHIIQHGLFTEIMGNKYVWVDGWTFAGFLLGLRPQVESVENLSTGTEYKYKATTKIYRGDQVVSVGMALCSNKENKKKTFDEYAVMSMSQTRSIGRAYRNLIGFVIRLAGYDATPADEMMKMGQTPQNAPTNPISQNLKPSEGLKGQVKGPDGEWTWVCAKCADPISDAGANVSLKMVGKRLCKEHYDESKKK